MSRGLVQCRWLSSILWERSLRCLLSCTTYRICHRIRKLSYGNGHFTCQRDAKMTTWNGARNGSGSSYIWGRLAFLHAMVSFKLNAYFQIHEFKVGKNIFAQRYKNDNISEVRFGHSYSTWYRYELWIAQFHTYAIESEIFTSQITRGERRECQLYENFQVVLL